MSNAAILELCFRREKSATFTPKDGTDFECYCWLCLQRLGVPEIADLESVRCPKRHLPPGFPLIQIKSRDLGGTK